ncbi:MAG: hypothetical protein DRQ47_07840 [Gammaproteobacteria bacterium]|nr:MAG: hypothetical protein DRQ47_07840 [Gammaproteobacteria bacterium]
MELKLWEKAVAYIILTLIAAVGYIGYAYIWKYFELVGVVTVTATLVWYFLTMVEWELNGGGIGYPYHWATKPFYALWHTLRSGSYSYCMKYAGDNKEHADMLYAARYVSLITPAVFLVAPITTSFIIEMFITF